MYTSNCRAVLTVSGEQYPSGQSSEIEGHGEKMHELMGMMSLFFKSLVRDFLFQLYEYCGISGIFLRQLETFDLASVI